MVYGCFIDQVNSKKLVILLTILTGITYIIVSVLMLSLRNYKEIVSFGIEEIKDLARGLSMFS